MKKTSGPGLTNADSASTLNHRNRRAASTAARSFIHIPVRLVPLTEAQDISDPSQNPEAETAASNRGKLMRALLASLQPADRALMLARFAGGMSLADIATREGVSKTAIHARLKRVVATLRAELRSRGITRIEELF